MMWNCGSILWFHCGVLSRQGRRTPKLRPDPATGGTDGQRQAAPRRSTAQPSCCRLVVLADEPPAFGDLVADTGLAKSTASRLLQALERHRLVHRDDDGGYEAGPLFALYASRHEPIDELIRLAQPDARGDRPRDRRDRQPRGRARQRGRPGRPGRLHVPARHDQLGRRRRPAALLRARQGLLRRRRAPAPDASRWSAAPATPSPAPPRFSRQLDDIRAQGYADGARRARDRPRRHRRARLRPRSARSWPPSASPVRATGVNHQLPQLAELLTIHARALSGAPRVHQPRKEGAA